MVHDAAIKAGVRLCGPLAWRERPDFTCFQAGNEMAQIARGARAELGDLHNTQCKTEVGPYASRYAVAGKGEGPPSRCGPSIVRPLVRLTPCRRTRRRGPRERQGSSSRMPRTSAKDNETLDHLLSVVSDSRNVGCDC